MNGWKQLPARLVYAGAVGGFGYFVVRGYQKTFPETDRRRRALVSAACSRRVLMGTDVALTSS